MELLDRANSRALANTDKSRRVFALAIDAEDGRVAVETGQVIGAGRVGEMMSDRHELGG